MNITAVNELTQMPQAIQEAGQSMQVDTSKQKDLARLKKACEQFESLFVYYMLKSMRSANEGESSLFGEGLGSDIYTQLFDQSLADKMAEKSPFGIGDMLMKAYAEKAGLSEEEYKTYDSIKTEPIYYTVPTTIQNSSTQKESTPKVDNSTAINSYDSIIESAALENNIDPNLVKAVIMQESGGNPEAVSPKGAKGLMQLMDGTAQMLGVTDPFDIAQNIYGGTKYLAKLITKFNGDIQKALAAYNAGPGNVEKYGGIPPFEETRNYVSSILDSLGDSNNL